MNGMNIDDKKLEMHDKETQTGEISDYQQPESPETGNMLSFFPIDVLSAGDKTKTRDNRN